MAIRYELYHKKDGLKINVIQQGIVSALVFATKQNIGIYYLMGLSVFIIYEYRKDIKQIFKKLFAIYTVYLGVTAIWVIALIIQGQFKDFINYCFLGIGEFANNHTSAIWEYLIFYLIPVVTIVILIIAVKRYKMSMQNDVVKKDNLLFVVFMFTALLIGYPIFNPYHVQLATLVSMVYCAYVFDALLISKMEDLFNRRIVKWNINCLYHYSIISKFLLYY